MRDDARRINDRRWRNPDLVRDRRDRGLGGHWRQQGVAHGRDLQFIRINGTRVGGLVGLILYTITR